MIDYQNLADSIKHYEKHGFRRIETPWTVTPAISEITKPPHCEDYKLMHNGKVLVASAEQSFLYLYLKGYLPKGKFQSITPCFRDELFDQIHWKYFMKNELIITDDVRLATLDDMVSCASIFFEDKLGKGVAIKQLDPKSYDIVWNGIELGSYGIRSCSYLDWIYGTGCAEPRLGHCKSLERRNWSAECKRLAEKEAEYYKDL